MGSLLFTTGVEILFLIYFITEADKGQSQNIYKIQKNIFKIQKNISNRNVYWKSSLKSLSNLKNF